MYVTPINGNTFQEIKFSDIFFMIDKVSLMLGAQQWNLQRCKHLATPFFHNVLGDFMQIQGYFFSKSHSYPHVFLVQSCPKDREMFNCIWPRLPSNDINECTEGSDDSGLALLMDKFTHLYSLATRKGWHMVGSSCNYVWMDFISGLS